MKSKVKSSNKIFGIVSVTLLSIYSLLMIFMMAWAFMNTFKHDLDFVWNPWWPNEIYGWHPENYVTAFSVFKVRLDNLPGEQYANALGMFINSILYAGGGAFVTIFVTCLMAYCCSNFDCKITRILYFVVIFVITTPIVGSLPSEFQMAKTLGFYDNMIGIYIMKGYFANVNFLIFYAMFRGISGTYTEAGLLDGAGYWRIYFKIMLPLAGSTFFAVYLLTFIAHWNDYSTPLMYLPSFPPLAYGLYMISVGSVESGQIDNAMTEPVKIAACFIVSLPIIIIFSIFNQKIMTNVSVGGLKG